MSDIIFENTNEISNEDNENISISKEEEQKYIDEMKITYTYPEQTDKNIQMTLYKKPEFYYNRIQTKTELKTYEEIDKYRTETCKIKKGLREHQNMLANFINPNTPFTGILCFHGLGSGKTCVGIAIAETFKKQVKKYNTKIFILVPSVLSKEQWYQQVLVCTGDTYLNSDIIATDKQKKDAHLQVKEYYKIMTHSSFRGHVLGDRIVDDKINNKNIYKKNEEGEYERDISGNEISNLNNTVLIVDEIHNFIGNTYGEALKKIIKKSTNLKLVLLTATPMTNYADDIIELINYLRPNDDKIIKNKVFTDFDTSKLHFVEGGEQYLSDMIRGYVSYIRGGDPLMYATRVDMGENIDELLFTKIYKCPVSKFQSNMYTTMAVELKIDVDNPNIELISKMLSICNFVFPVVDKDNNNIIGTFGINGLLILLDQIENNNKTLTKLISDTFKIKLTDTLITKSLTHNTISGDILLMENLKNFSSKFYNCLINLNELVDGKKGAKNAFIYSNVVKIGIELFSEILNMNGYLEYQEDKNSYIIKNNTRCYFCGNIYKSHPTTHIFYPATYILITGKSRDETAEVIPEKSKLILDNVFNNISNKTGKYIKFVLGSKVMNEGINLKNIGEIHILDVSYNFKTIEQTIGRGIRWCSHYDVMSKDNVYPEVSTYKYVVSIPQQLTIEEELYKRSEQKYLLIKKVERILKENAIDCPLNYAANIIPSQVKKYENCIIPKNGDKYNPNYCPAECDFTKCDYECNDTKLNLTFYDKTKKIYKIINKDELDYSTFTRDLALTEIIFIKQHIKNMYIIKYLYTIEELKQKIKNIYTIDKRELYDDFFLYKAVDELIPITENDFNTFNDFVFDKYNRKGYLIYIDTYYIFQPFDEPESIPMYYRTTISNTINPEFSLFNYLKQNYGDILLKSNITNSTKTIDYIFDMNYYDSRNEYEIVGIIDNKNGEDLFKIRPKRNKNSIKKRDLGLPTLKGSVCWNSKTSNELNKISKQLNITNNTDNRKEICVNIQNKLLELEKHATGKNKLTYVMIPQNHKLYKFPYNLEDRKEYIIQKLKNHKLSFDKSKIVISNKDLLDEELTLIKYYNGQLINNSWVIDLN